MLFNSFIFWVFFAGVFALYISLAQRWQNRMLLVASYVFYGWWDWRFLSLMLFSTVVDYIAGRKLHATVEAAHAGPPPADGQPVTPDRTWLWVSMGTNLGLLGVFKYFNFFVGSAQSLLASAGLEIDTWSLSIVLPVGISFYTFQTMSYTIDIYRRRLKPTGDFLNFALFVSFFPQLVAGPIERASHLLPQIEKPRRIACDDLARGAMLCVIGLFKKVAIADMLAPLAQQCFHDPKLCDGGTLLFGLYCFSIQIYADFSGYSDIARGVARMMGFDLMENFNQPYFSASITEFWRRWHISLSSWLRDYLYIPLGGNRFGTFQTYRNLFLTMFLGGLWHGAAWTYVAWGVLHGVYLAVHKWMLGERKPPDTPEKRGVKGWALYLLKTVATFHLVALTWIFFRAEDFARAFQYCVGLFTWRAEKLLPREHVSFDSDDVNLAIAGLLTLWLLVDIPQYAKKDHEALLSWRFGWRVAALCVLCLWVVLARRTDSVPFIYFQF